MAENNFWGSDSYDEISKNNYDFKNDRKYGEIFFDPVLGGNRRLNNLNVLANTTPISNETLLQNQQTPGNIMEGPAGAFPNNAEEEIEADAAITELKHRTLDDLINEYEEDIKVTEQETEDMVEEKPLKIDYESVFLDAFIDHKEIINKVAPIVRDANRSLGAHGRIIVKVIVDKKGMVEDATVLKGLNLYLDDIALKAARKFTFKPGTIKGTPVRFSTTLLFEF